MENGTDPQKMFMDALRTIVMDREESKKMQNESSTKGRYHAELYKVAVKTVESIDEVGGPCTECGRTASIHILDEVDKDTHAKVTNGCQFTPQNSWDRVFLQTCKIMRKIAGQ